MPLPEITERLVGAYRAEGLTVAIVESSPLMARIEVASDGQLCEVEGGPDWDRYLDG